MIGGTLPAGGGPTITVSPRTSVPARSVSNAVPAVPVVTVSVAVSEPARTTTVPSTVATAGLVLVTVTGVSAAAGVGSIGTVTVCWPLARASSRPMDRGGRACAAPPALSSPPSSPAARSCPSPSRRGRRARSPPGTASWSSHPLRAA